MEVLPECLAMGIKEQEFWDMNNYELAPFFKAEEVKLRKKNAEFHLLGQYIYHGFAVVISNAFGGRGSSKCEYPQKPYDIFGKSEEELEEEQLRNEEILKAQIMAFAENMKGKENGGT